MNRHLRAACDAFLRILPLQRSARHPDGSASRLLPFAASSTRALSAAALFSTTGLLLWGAAELSHRPQQVVALEPTQSNLAAARLWSGASFPVENFQAYTSPFGYRNDPYGGNRRFHYGLDLAAPSGSYIRNWWSGRVVEVSDNTSCGTSVIVQSGDWQHIYCHMHGHVINDGNGRTMVDNDGGIRIREGQEIGSGARIGRVGMTGRTTGPHLHWGLKYQSNWVDPALVLQAMYDSQRISRTQ